MSNQFIASRLSVMKELLGGGGISSGEWQALCRQNTLLQSIESWGRDLAVVQSPILRLYSDFSGDGQPPAGQTDRHSDAAKCSGVGERLGRQQPMANVPLYLNRHVV